MSNIFYSIQVKEREDKELVINSNDLIQEKLEELQKAKELQAVQNIEPETEIMLEPVLDEEGNPVLDENGDPVTREIEVPVIPDSSVSTEEILRQAEEEAESIRARAYEDADDIHQNAMAEAQVMKNNAYEEGKREGYQEGTRAAEAEMQVQRETLERERQEQRADYEARLSTMEMDLVDKLTEVIDHVFHSKISGDKDIILHLMENALSRAQGSKEFQIRLSSENAKHFSERKGELLARLPEGVQLDLIEDPLMSDTDCTIETDGGIFDCSVDTEFNGLIQDIRALSKE